MGNELDKIVEELNINEDEDNEIPASQTIPFSDFSGEDCSTPARKPLSSGIYFLMMLKILNGM